MLETGEKECQNYLWIVREELIEGVEWVCYFNEFLTFYTVEFLLYTNSVWIKYNFQLFSRFKKFFILKILINKFFKIYVSYCH